MVQFLLAINKFSNLHITMYNVMASKEANSLLKDSIQNYILKICPLILFFL